MAPRRCGASARQAREVRQPVEREVHLAGRAAEPVPPQVLDEVVRQMRLAHEPEERQSGIRAGRDDACAQFVAVPQHHSRGASVLDQHLRDGRVGADLDPRLPGGGGDRERNGAGAAPGKAPRAERAVDLAHVVVQQHVGRTRRAHAEERADDAGRRHSRLEHVGLEPPVEKIDRAHRHQLRQVVAIAGRELQEAPPHLRERSDITRVQRQRIGGRHLDDRFDEARHLHHRPPVLVVGFRIGFRVSRNLPVRRRVVVHPP